MTTQTLADVLNARESHDGSSSYPVPATWMQGADHLWRVFVGADAGDGARTS